MAFWDRFIGRKQVNVQEVLSDAVKAWGLENYGEFIGDVFSELSGGGGFVGAPAPFYEDYWRRLIDELPGRSDHASYNVIHDLSMSNPFASRSIGAIAQTISSIPLEAYKVTGKGERKVAKDHPVFELLAGPNGKRTTLSIFEPIVQHMYFGGECFFYMNVARSESSLRPLALEIYCPTKFKEFIYKGVNEPRGFSRLIGSASYRKIPMGYQAGYIFDGKARVGYHPTYQRDPIVASEDEVLHIRRHSKHRPQRGLPLIWGARNSLLGASMAENWNRNLSKLGGYSPGHYVPENMKDGKQLSPEKREMAQKDLDRQVVERQAKNLPHLLTGAWKYIPTRMTPREADFKEAEKFYALKILSAIGVPPVLGGYIEGQGLGGGSVMKQAKALFYEGCVLPFFDDLLEEFNKGIMSRFPGGYELGYNKELIEALQPELSELFKRINLATGRPWLTQNEGRRATGYDPDTSDPKYDEIREPSGKGEGSDEKERTDERSDYERDNENETPNNRNA